MVKLNKNKEKTFNENICHIHPIYNSYASRENGNIVKIDEMKNINRYNKNLYYIHPIYNSYASSENGHIIKINEMKKINMYDNDGYLYMNIDGMNETLEYSVNQFVWECFNDELPEGYVIENINDNKRDKRISNLRFVSNKVKQKSIK